MNSDEESSVAPQNIKFKHGGSRAGSGRPQRKPLPWPENTNVKTARGLDDFLCYLIEEFTKTNPMDARALGALNTTVKMLLDLRHWNDLEACPRDLELEYVEDKANKNIENNEVKVDNNIEEKNPVETIPRNPVETCPTIGLEKLVAFSEEMLPFLKPGEQEKAWQVIKQTKEKIQKIKARTNNQA